MLSKDHPWPHNSRLFALSLLPPSLPHHACQNSRITVREPMALCCAFIACGSTSIPLHFHPSVCQAFVSTNDLFMFLPPSLYLYYGLWALQLIANHKSWLFMLAPFCFKGLMCTVPIFFADFGLDFQKWPSPAAHLLHKFSNITLTHFQIYFLTRLVPRHIRDLLLRAR